MEAENADIRGLLHPFTPIHVSEKEIQPPTDRPTDRPTVPCSWDDAENERRAERNKEERAIEQKPSA